MNEQHARQIVTERSEGFCEVQISGTCFGLAGNWHHRRTAGRVWTPGNGLHLCGSGATGCHGWITEHPEASLVNGWSISNFADAAAVHLVPVLLAAGWGLLHPQEPRYLPIRAE